MEEPAGHEPASRHAVVALPVELQFLPAHERRTFVAEGWGVR